MKPWRKFIAMFIVVPLVITGCSSSKPTANAPQPQPEPVEEGQTITVTNLEPSPSNISTGDDKSSDGTKYQIQTRLTDFQLLSDSTGLAWGTTRGELRLYSTMDNGVTWTNISPSSAIQFSNNPRYGKEIYFTDPDHGWIVRRSIASDQAVILRTTNGGATWKLSSLSNSLEVAAIQFVDAKYGFIMTVGDQGGDKEAKVLFETEDGGATWVEKMSNDALPNETKRNLVLPKEASFVSMEFTSRNNGYITMIKAGIPSLYTTSDGGIDWREQDNFFDRSKYQDADQFTIGALSAFNDQSDTGWISVGIIRNDESKYNGYFTSDAGKTWKLVNFKLPWQQGVNAELSPVFLNAKEGWTIHNTTVLHTTDQGENWTSLPQSQQLENIINDYPEIVKLQFFTSKVGWLLVAKNDQKRSLLLQTTDGGATWSVL